MKILVPFCLAVLVAFSSCSEVEAPIVDVPETPVDTVVDVPDVPVTPTNITLGEASMIVTGTPDLQASMDFYSKLGFTTVMQSDDPTPMAYMSDNTAMIGLFQDGEEYIGLCYYTTDFANQTKRLETAGFILDDEYREGVTMNVYLNPDSSMAIAIMEQSAIGLYQPSGPDLRDMNMDLSDSSKYPNPKCGVYGEFSIAVSDLAAEAKRWEAIGFTVEQNQMPYPWGTATDGQQIIGLHQNPDQEPSFTFFSKDAFPLMEALKKEGITEYEILMPEIFGEKHFILTTPEGNFVNLFSL